MDMEKKFLVCIDSDGCVFDTMEIKHKECFCPAYIKHFGLQAVSKYAREAWEFTNLYSDKRGVHRLLALVRAMEVLSYRREVKERSFDVPDMKELKGYLAEGGALLLPEIRRYFEAHPDSDEFARILAWSDDVNERIADTVYGVPPFPHVRECLEKLSRYADVVIVSATPEEALLREWDEHGLLSLVSAVKGQESGTKKEMIASFKEKYQDGHILMLGDAPGDLVAAKYNGVLFYPICPDEEARSWADFREVIDAFINVKYAGGLEGEKIAYFEKLLPKEPDWKE